MPRKVVEEVVLDPTNEFEAALIDMVQMNRRKRADYATENNPYQNFEEAAYSANLPTVGHGIEYMIATKQSRLTNLLKDGREPANESVEDSILDRAVYSVISLAGYRAGQYFQD